MANKGNNNHHANQLNSNNTTLDHNNRDYKNAMDNHANQCNPNNQNYKGGKK